MSYAPSWHVRERKPAILLIIRYATDSDEESQVRQGLLLAQLEF